MRTLMTRAYENSENQLSSFFSNVKLDVVKNMNVGVSLEFMKGVANEWEKFPKNVAISYDNDDYFMKTFMTKLSKSLEDVDIPTRFNRFQASATDLKYAVSKTLYNWLIDAKLYDSIHQPAKVYCISNILDFK